MLMQHALIQEGCRLDPHRSIVKATACLRREVNRIMHHAEGAQHGQRGRDEQADEEDEPMITVLLVTDEAIVREGLRMRLVLEADMTIVGSARTLAPITPLRPPPQSASACSSPDGTFPLVS